MVLCFPPRFSPFGEVTRGERLPPPLAPLLDESSPCSWKLIFPQLSSFGLQFSDTFLCTHTHLTRGGSRRLLLFTCLATFHCHRVSIFPNKALLCSSALLHSRSHSGLLRILSPCSTSCVSSSSSSSPSSWPRI